MGRRTTTGLSVGLILCGALLGCGADTTPRGEDTTTAAPETDVETTDTDADADADDGLAAADTSVCAADATSVPTPYGAAFPADWAFPAQTTVYDVEEREGAGTIVTGISTAPYDDVLAFLNDDQPAAGYAITGGETEEDDAEADFTVDGYSGRWSIRSSASCAGETVVQVVAFVPGG